MRSLLHVLALALSRFLQSCADILARLGNPGDGSPAVADPAASIRTSVPPEDWLRRTNPPPPAHWTKIVRSRAPGFLRDTPEHRAPRLRLPAPAMRSEKRSPLKEAVPPAPREEQRPGPESDFTPPRSTPGRSGIPGLAWTSSQSAGAPRALRVVTVVEEKPQRKASEVRALGERSREARPRDAASPVLEPSDRSRETDSPLRSLPERPERSGEAVQVPDEGRAVQREEESWDPLLQPSLATVALPAVPGSAALPALESPEGILRAAVPSGPGFDRPREQSSSLPEHRSDAFTVPPGSAPRWPELPMSAENDDLDDARLLLRELRRQSELEREQRGMPWSA